MSNITPSKFAPDNRSAQEIARELRDAVLGEKKVAYPETPINDAGFTGTLKLEVEMAQKNPEKTSLDEQLRRYKMGNFIESAEALAEVIEKIAKGNTALSANEKTVLSNALYVAEGAIYDAKLNAEHWKNEIQTADTSLATWFRMVMTDDKHQDIAEGNRELGSGGYYLYSNIAANIRTHSIPNLQALATKLGISLDSPEMQ